MLGKFFGRKISFLLVVAVIATLVIGVVQASANKIKDMLELIEQIDAQIQALEAQLEILKQMDPPPTDLILQLEMQILTLKLQKLELQIDALEVSIKTPPPEEVYLLSTWVVEYYIYNPNDCEIDVCYELEPEIVHTSGAVVVIPDIRNPEVWDYYHFGKKSTIAPGATQEFIISLLPPKGVEEFTPKVIMKEFYTRAEFFSHEFTIRVIIPKLPSFYGWVRNYAGHPIEADVMAISFPKATKTVSKEGYYEFSGLEPGIYWLVAWKQYYFADIRRVVLSRSDKAIQVDFRLKLKLFQIKPELMMEER